MPQVVYTSEKGLVTSAGTGFTITNGPIAIGSETVTDAGAASVQAPLTLLVDTDGLASVVSLAAGTEIGQVKRFLCTAVTTGTSVLTPAAGLGLGAWATVTFSAVGQTCALTWDGNGWAVSSRSSCTTATAAVVTGMPVVA